MARVTPFRYGFEDDGRIDEAGDQRTQQYEEEG
jgi:hypothetical protein